MINILLKCIDVLGISINNNYFNNISLYWNYLLSVNEHINLISRAGKDDIRFISHIVDSLTGLLFDWPDEINCIDLGSGGGLPGLPLKICHPGWAITLVEAKTKKATFLAEAAKRLDLSLVTVMNDHLRPRSSWASPDFDLVTTRGLATIKDSLPLVNPLLKPGGLYLAYKGPKGSNEIFDSNSLLIKYNIKLIKVKEFTLPIVNLPRSLYLFQKQ